MINEKLKLINEKKKWRTIQEAVAELSLGMGNMAQLLEQFKKLGPISESMKKVEGLGLLGMGNMAQLLEQFKKLGPISESMKKVEGLGLLGMGNMAQLLEQNHEQFKKLGPISESMKKVEGLELQKTLEPVERRYIRDLENLVTTYKKTIKEQDKKIKELEAYIKWLKGKRKSDHYIQ